jgi:trans-aconitate methyltransferase
MFEERSSIRRIDLRYLNRDPKLDFRPYFEFVIEFIRPYFANSEMSLLDIGCGNAAFLHHVIKVFPHVKGFGLDSLPQLVAKASLEIPEAQFMVGDILDVKTLPKKNLTWSLCLLYILILISWMSYCPIALIW